jgi:hypothetical protein
MAALGKWFVGVAGVLVIASWTCLAADDEAAAPKHTIKEVMANAHKAGLLKKVLADQATQEEKLVLLDHYISLAENVPAKGDEAGWHEKTGLIVMAAAKVSVGREGSLELLKTTTNCKACHDDHK